VRWFQRLAWGKGCLQEKDCLAADALVLVVGIRDHRSSVHCASRLSRDGAHGTVLANGSSVRKRWRYFLLLVSTVISAAGLVGCWASSPALGPVAITPTLQLGSPGCQQDPARLPPPPPSPDGRPANYLHTCGNRLYDSQGREVRITGINWFGMETGDHAPGGLNERNWQDVLDQIASLGYNTIRIPYSNEALDPNSRVGGIDPQLNPDLVGLSGLQMLDRLVQGARDRGLKIVLDRHKPTAYDSPELWYTEQVPESRWIADWRMLAARYAGNDTVIGFDLSNEPRGAASWGTGDVATDWRLAAERAGNAILDVNPYLLIFVEGIEHYNGEKFWWGGDLQGVRSAPVRLKVSDRIVYSPHDYGPEVSGQPWFWDPRFPSNMPAEWDRRWGYIQKEGLAPVVVGEFGGRSLGSDADGAWQRALLAYLRENEMGFLVWSLNPNWDVGGVLESDWRSVDQTKQKAYASLLAPPLAVGARGVFGQAPSRWQVFFRQEEAAPRARDISFSLRLANQGPSPVDLSRLEVRYWFRAEGLSEARLQAAARSAEVNAPGVKVDVVAANQGGQDHYIRISFRAAARSLGRYTTTDPITVRLRYSDSSLHLQSDDYSFAGAPVASDRFQEWERVTLYLDGKLVWGKEP